MYPNRLNLSLTFNTNYVIESTFIDLTRDVAGRERYVTFVITAIISQQQVSVIKTYVDLPFYADLILAKKSPVNLLSPLGRDKVKLAGVEVLELLPLHQCKVSLELVGYIY